MTPLPLYFSANVIEVRFAMMQAKVLIEPSQHRDELTLLITLLPVHMPLEPLLGLGQELSAAFDAGYPHQGKLATSVHSANVFETQEVKRLWLFANLLQVRPHEAPKAHQPRLLFSQFQSELREPIRQALLEPFRIALVLEVH